MDIEFQSTPSTRRVTAIDIQPIIEEIISIHTLHTEGDEMTLNTYTHTDISIHTLHTEGDILGDEYDLE